MPVVKCIILAEGVFAGICAKLTLARALHEVIGPMEKIGERVVVEAGCMAMGGLVADAVCKKSEKLADSIEQLFQKKSE